MRSVKDYAIVFEVLFYANVAFLQVQSNCQHNHADWPSHAYLWWNNFCKFEKLQFKALSFNSFKSFYFFPSP